MAEDINGAASIVNNEIKEAEKETKVSTLLSKVIDGFEKALKSIDAFLIKRNVDLKKLANKAKDSKAGKAISSMKDKAVKKFGATGLGSDLLEKGIQATMKDKYSKWKTSGTEPPGMETNKGGFINALKRDAGKALGFGKKVTSKAGGNYIEELGFDLRLDLEKSSGPIDKLFKSYATALNELRDARKDKPVNPTKVDMLYTRAMEISQTVNSIITEYDEKAVKAEKMFEEQVAKDGKGDRRLLKLRLLVNRYLAKFKTLDRLALEQLGERKITKEDREAYKEAEDRFNKQSYLDELKYNSLEDNETFHGGGVTGMVKGAATGLLGASLNKVGIKNTLGTPLTKEEQEGEQKLPSNFITNQLKSMGDKILEGPFGYGKSIRNKVQGKEDKVSAMDSIGRTGLKLAGLSLLGPTALAGYGAYRLGKSAIKKDGIIGSRIRAGTKNLFGSNSSGSLLDAVYDKDGNVIQNDMSTTIPGLSNVKLAETQRSKFGVGDKGEFPLVPKSLGNSFIDAYRKRKAEIAEKKRLKKEKKENMVGPQPLSKFGKMRENGKKAFKGMLGTLGSFGSAFLGDVGDAILNGEEEGPSELSHEATSVATKVDENSPEWIKDKAAREQARIDEVQREKEAVRARLEAKKKAEAGGGFLGKLLGGLKHLFTGLLLPALGALFTKAIGPLLNLIKTGVMKSLEFLGKKFMDLGKFLGDKLLGLGSYLGEKLGGFMSKVGSMAKKATDWVKGTKVGQAVGKATSWFKGTKIGGLLSKAANFVTSKAGTIVRSGLAMAGRVGAMIFSGPVGWVVGVGLLAVSIYGLYKWMNNGGDPPDTPTGNLTKARLLSYGVDSIDSGNYNKIFQIEEAVGKIVTRNRESGQIELKPIDEDRAAEINAVLDISEENPDLNETKMTWLHERFIPAYTAHLRALWIVNENLKLGELDRLSLTELENFTNNIEVPAEVFNVKVLPFPEHPFTEVMKKDFDELIVKVKRELKDKIKENKLPENHADKNKKITSDQAKAAEKAWSDRLKDQINKDGPNSFGKYFVNKDEAKAGGSLSTTGLANVHDLRGSEDSEPVMFGGGGDYNFKSGQYQDISQANTMNLVDAMKEASKLTGVPEELLWTFAKIESSLNPSAKASTSSAGGLFQFLDGTWKEMIEKTGGKYGLNLRNASKFNPLHAAVMGAEYMKNNLWAAQKFVPEGIDLGTGLYLSHFFGPGGANNALAAYKRNPNAPMYEVVSDSGYRANASVMKGKTVAQFFKYYQDRFHKFMKMKPEEFAGYKSHKKANASLYEGVGEANYMNTDINYDNFGKGTGGDISGSGLGSGFQYETTPNGNNGNNTISQQAGGSGNNYRYDPAIDGPRNPNDPSQGDYGSDDTDIYGGDFDAEFGELSGAPVAIHPIPKGTKGVVIVSWFGPRNPKESGASKDHMGIDFAAVRGTPVLSTGNGVVTRAESAGANGNIIEVTHSGDTVTKYCHLDSFKVKKGEKVKAGQVIGTVGNTCNGKIANMGYHLHFGTYINGKPVDPWNFPAIRSGPGGVALPVRTNSSVNDPRRNGPLGGQIPLGEEYKNTGAVSTTSVDQNPDMSAPMSDSSMFGSMKPTSNKLSSNLMSGYGGTNNMYLGEAGSNPITEEVMSSDASGIDGGVKHDPNANQPNINLDNSGVEEGIGTSNELLNRISTFMEELVKQGKATNSTKNSDGSTTYQVKESELDRRKRESNERFNSIREEEAAKKKQIPSNSQVKFTRGNNTGIDVSKNR